MFYKLPVGRGVQGRMGVTGNPIAFLGGQLWVTIGKIWDFRPLGQLLDARKEFPATKTSTWICLVRDFFTDCIMANHH